MCYNSTVMLNQNYNEISFCEISPVRTVIIERQKLTSVGEDVEKVELLNFW